MSKYFTNLPWGRPNVIPWVILFFATLNVIFLGGKRKAFGGFVAVLRKDFSNITLTELNWIGDSYAAFGYMTTSLSTMAILHFNRRYSFFQFLGAIFIFISCITSSVVPNPHWMFLTHTLFHGIGSSLIISTVALVVNEHFDKKHPYHLLATTLVSGGTVASIVFVPFFAFLIQTHNWRIGFLILGGLYFVVNSSAAFFFQKSDNLSELSNQKLSCNCSDINNKQIPLLALWFIDRIMTSVVTYGLIMNLTDFVHRTQTSLVDSTVMTTLYAAGEASTYLIGAVITAATKDFFKNKLRYILLITSFLMCVTMICLEFTILIIPVRNTLCFIAGFTLGPSITFLFPAGEELTRLPGHIAYPFSLGGMGFGMLISPLMTAKVAEIFHYKWFFLVQGGLIFIKFICLFLITILLFYYKNYQQDKESTELMFTDDEVDNDTPTETTQLISEDPKK